MLFWYFLGFIIISLVDAYVRHPDMEELYGDTYNTGVFKPKDLVDYGTSGSGSIDMAHAAMFMNLDE